MLAWLIFRVKNDFDQTLLNVGIILFLTLTYETGDIELNETEKRAYSFCCGKLNRVVDFSKLCNKRVIAYAENFI